MVLYYMVKRIMGGCGQTFKYFVTRKHVNGKGAAWVKSVGKRVTSGIRSARGQEQQTQWVNREGTAGGYLKKQAGKRQAGQVVWRRKERRQRLQ
jgi:hypothetical protein